MVNLVLVSHAQEIALGTKALAEQMANATVRIEAAGGILDRRQSTNEKPAKEEDPASLRLGTDAERIVVAIERCWSEDGVLILVDLGSAVLSAELALELLSDEMRARCLISNAPLVEGAVVAALEASLGHSLVAVNEAAEGIIAIPKVVRE
jgi:dihydroxyacetone kinase DhaKLM complex PTS-EIIA-like component DhaM